MNDYEFWLNTAFDLLDQVRSYPKSNTTWTTTRYEDVPTHNRVNMPAVRQVIFNNNATVVYFDDDTKVVVRKSAQDEYNIEHAIVYAIVKRAYGIVNGDGIVDGNGMGNMLGRLIKNAIDQDAQVAAKKAKEKAKKEASSRILMEATTTQKYDCRDRVEPWPTSKADVPSRDSKGRFVKKANRK